MPAGEWRGPRRREYSATEPELMRGVIGQVYDGVVLTAGNRDSADRVLASAEAAASPLIVGSTGRLLAATALAVFPNTVLAAPGRPGPRRCLLGDVAARDRVIDEHAHDDITGAQIAAAAGCPRPAWRTGQGVTPVAVGQVCGISRSMKPRFLGSGGTARLSARLAGLARDRAGQRAGQYRGSHLAEGQPGVDADRAGCAQPVLVSGQKAAQVLASVPDPAPVVVVAARIQPRQHGGLIDLQQEHLGEAVGQL